MHLRPLEAPSAEPQAGSWDGVTHPSAPNYLDIFSGSNQGVTADSFNPQAFSAPNLGSELIGAALSRASRGGWQCVFVVGAPRFYERFGFSSALAAGFTSRFAGATSGSFSLNRYQTSFFSCGAISRR